MKKSTIGFIGILAGVATAVASAIVIGTNAKQESSDDHYADYVDDTDSDETIVEIED